MTFAFRGYEYSRLVILIFLAQSIVAVSLARAALREALRFARRHGYNLRYAIVVGGGEPAAEVLRILNRRRDAGIFVLGLLSDKKEVPENVRWLGGIEDVRTVLDRQQVDIVFIALPHADASRLTAVLSGIGDDPIAIHLVPDVFSLVPARGGIEEFEMVPFIHLRESRLYGLNRVLARAFDLVFGGLGLAVAAPIMLAIAVGLKLTTPGPVLYHQERMGVDGRRFRMLKFRTMRVDAEAETGPVWARPDDPRRTALGVFLRRTSLDELPQLFNVLRGEMSLVGPRPERPSFVEEFRRRVPGYMLRHKVKAGITGWAQINGWRGDTSIEKRIECDLYYLERGEPGGVAWAPHAPGLLCRVPRAAGRTPGRAFRERAPDRHRDRGAPVDRAGRLLSDRRLARVEPRGDPAAHAQVRAGSGVLLDLYDARRRSHPRAGQRTSARRAGRSVGGLGGPGLARRSRVARAHVGARRVARLRRGRRGVRARPAPSLARPGRAGARSRGRARRRPGIAPAREECRRSRRRHDARSARDARRGARAGDRASAQRNRARSGQEHLSDGGVPGGAAALDQSSPQHAAPDRRGARAAWSRGVACHLGRLLRRGVAGVQAHSTG